MSEPMMPIIPIITPKELLAELKHTRDNCDYESWEPSSIGTLHSILAGKLYGRRYPVTAEHKDIACMLIFGFIKWCLEPLSEDKSQSQMTRALHPAFIAALNYKGGFPVQPPFPGEGIEDHGAEG